MRHPIPQITILSLETRKKKKKNEKLGIIKSLLPKFIGATNIRPIGRAVTRLPLERKI